jgi:PBSX family phage terminase large subunit
MDIPTSKLIIERYEGLLKDVLRHGHTHYTLYGGRGSTKSSFVAIAAVLLLLSDRKYNAICFRKVANTIRHTVFPQYLYALELLGVTDRFRAIQSPFEITYTATGQKIMFHGMDDPGKLKSLKAQTGYFAVTHFEELDQFAGREETRTVIQSTMRGGGADAFFWNFETFNPPISASNWANLDLLNVNPNRLVVRSSYLDVPVDWLSREFFDEAEYVKKINPRAYEHEYLGVATGTGGNVFENLKDELPEVEAESGGDTLYGVDFGYYPDPWAFAVCRYDAARRALYVVDEAKAFKLNNRAAYEIIREHGVGDGDLVICDSAEPKSIADYAEYGLYVKGAEKAPDSVRYSIKWLQGLTAIYIDNENCPNAYKEFSTYEYTRTRDGELVSAYPDKENHFIDAVRYATNLLWRRRGV